MFQKDNNGRNPTRDLGVLRPNGGFAMEEQRDREARIGTGLVLGLVAFILIAILSAYFQQPHQLTTSIRDNVASTAR